MPDFTELFKKLLDFETSINAGKSDINEFRWTSSDLIWADTPSARRSFAPVLYRSRKPKIPGLGAAGGGFFILSVPNDWNGIERLMIRTTDRR